MDSGWPLTGRAAELQHLRRLLADDDARGVLIAGPVGVGRTRLADEAVRLAEQAQLRPVRISATASATSIPLGAFASLWSPAGGPPPPEGLADDLGEAIRRHLDRIHADGRRPAVIVDDAHLLDDASATLVHQLATGGRAFLLATAVAGSFVPDSLLRLWKDEVIPRVDLRPLSADVVADLLRGSLGSRVERGTVALLYERAGGNLVLLRELVNCSLESGLLTRAENEPWRMSGPAPLNERLMEIVEAQLGELSPDEREFLEVLAVAESAGQAELRAAGGVAMALALEGAGLLTSRRDGRRLTMRLRHPLHAEVLRLRISPLRRASIAGRLADQVEAAGARRGDDVLRLASWRLDAGGTSPHQLLAAAAMARWRFDFPLAERLARAARDDGAGFEAGLLIGQTAGLQGRIAEAEKWLAAMESEAVTDDQRGSLAMARLDNLAYDFGRLADALAIADSAEAELSSQGWRDEITARRLALILALRGPRAQAQVAEPLVARATGRTLAWASVELAYSLGRLGRLEEALQIAARGYQVHTALVEPFEWSPWMHLFLRCDILAHFGDLTAAEELAAGEREQGIDGGDIETQAFFALYLAKVVGERGHVASAIRHAEESVGLFRKLGRLQMIRFGLIYLALAHALAGHGDVATAVMQEVDDMGLPENFLTGVDLYQARAWTSVAVGKVSEAQKILREAARVAREIGDHIGEAAALHAIARLDGGTSDLPRLTELADLVEGELVAARQAHVVALAGDRAEDLTRVSELFESMGADLLAAEAAADAAVAWRRLGDARKIAAAEWRTQVLVEACEGPSTPALRSIHTRAMLSPAQRSVALLAAEGKSNHDIADDLQLSVRTVENHLQAVYRKLGLRRTDLAARLTAVRVR